MQYTLAMAFSRGIMSGKQVAEFLTIYKGLKS